MVTASHNPEQDNGLKLVEPSGEMLESAWEEHATQLAQAATDDQLLTVLSSLAAALPAAGGAPGKVIVGRDTRPSGLPLAAACSAGVEAVGAQVLDIGIVTTPELHFTVQTYNKYQALEEQAYFTNLLESFRTLTAGTPAPQQPLHVDCANGVGAQKLQQMSAQLQKLGLQLVLFNAGQGRLNHLCGADYVQKEQTFPAGGCLVRKDVVARAKPIIRDCRAAHALLLLLDPSAVGKQSGPGRGSGMLLAHHHQHRATRC